MPVNPFLMQEVKRAMAAKRAFVPASAAGGAPPMDPAAAGGAPPMDPAAAGGAPPPMDPAAMGGAPPMDPAMMGGAPPMDPAAMAAPAPAPSGPSADDIRQLIKEELQSAMSGGAAGGAPKGKGSAKVDPAQILEYMERVQKLIVNLYESLGLNLPYNILDKPAPEGAEGEAAEPAKDKGSDVNASGIPPIKPIEPMGGSKQAAVKTQAEALRYMLEAISKGR